LQILVSRTPPSKTNVSGPTAIVPGYRPATCAVSAPASPGRGAADAGAAVFEPGTSYPVSANNSSSAKAVLRRTATFTASILTPLWLLFPILGSTAGATGVSHPRLLDKHRMRPGRPLFSDLQYRWRTIALSRGMGVRGEIQDLKNAGCAVL
jgi:hypothetical protein